MAANSSAAISKRQENNRSKIAGSAAAIAAGFLR
jgi:hypothetical protein